MAERGGRVFMPEGGDISPSMQPLKSQASATPERGKISLEAVHPPWRPRRRGKLNKEEKERMIEFTRLRALFGRVEETEDAEEEERLMLRHFFFGEVEELSADHQAAEKKLRREQQEAAYRKALREKKKRRDELRKVFMARPTRLLHKTHPRGYTTSRGLYSAVSSAVKKEEEEEEKEEECVGLEPFFFDEAKRKQKEQKELEAAREEQMLLRRWKAHMSVIDSIRDYNHKLKRSYLRRFYFADLSTFDLDEESPLGPMRYTRDAFHLDGTVCKQDERRFLLLDSVNVLSVKVTSSDLGFPINVYGTVIARDSLDKMCVYLFRRDRNHCQLIDSEDNSLILTGPKRGLCLKSFVYFEVDLRIKGDQGQKDKQLSNGFLTLDIIPRLSWDKMKVETDSINTKLGVLDVTFVVVKHAVEATVAIEVLEGEFFGKITACPTSLKNCLVLHDSKMAGVITCDGKRVVQMLRPTVAVFVKEKLEVTVAAQTGVDEVKSTIIFTPRASGVVEDEITCGPVKMLVKVSWSIIACLPFEVTE